MKSRWLLLLVLTGLTLHGSTKSGRCAPNVTETTNPGFENAYTAIDASNAHASIQGEVAQGWSDNSNWADVGVQYSQERSDPHSGASAQKIQVDRVNSGAVQFAQTVPLRSGRILSWKLWLRGRPGDTVNLIIRQEGAPYFTYASETATLSAEWQEFRVYGPVPENTDGYLMVVATSPMTFWVDDSTLEDLTSAQSDAPPKTGNLLTGGGSFEAGIPYGWSTRYEGQQGFRPEDPRPQIDATSAAVGKNSLRCVMPAGSSLRVSSPLLPFNYGRAHTLSFWAKASRLDTPLNAGLEKAFDQNLNLGTEWKRYVISGQLPFMPSTQIRFQVPETATANTVWLDGVQLEEAAQASSPYLAPEPVELSLQLPQPGHVLLGKETGLVAIQVAGPLLARTKLQLMVTDLAGKTQSLPALTLPASSFELPSLNNRFGMWKVRAQVMDKSGKTLSAPFDLVWARLPPAKTIDPNRSYFGLHLPLNQNYFDIARRIGARRTRLHDTSMVGKWNAVEPQQDHYQFFDEGIDLAKKSGLAVLGMLDGAPSWTTTQPRQGYWGFWNIPDQPGARDHWDNYVRRTVGHYKGRIDQWEIWNEPWGAWWLDSGNPHATVQLYGELSRRAYAVAKIANPDVSILGIDTYPANAWTLNVLPEVTPAYFDGFSFHEYTDSIYGGPNPIPMLRRGEFLTAQAKYGTPKPLWMTEGGPSAVGSWLAPETGGMPPALQATYIVRRDVTNMAAGIKAFYLYAMPTDPELGATAFTMSEYDRSIKPILGARAVLASLVDGLGVPVRSEPVKGLDLYTYPGGKLSVLWSYEGGPINVKVPSGVKALDVWANSLKASGTMSVGSEPVYWVRQ